MKILFLDDMKVRHDAFLRNHIGHEIVQVWTAPEAKTALDTQSFDLAMLDHDLSEEHYLTLSQGLSEERLPGAEEYKPGTGMDVVDHIIAMPEEKRPKRVIVHSFNPRGGEMVERLMRAEVWAVWVRFNPNTRYA